MGSRWWRNTYKGTHWQKTSEFSNSTGIMQGIIHFETTFRQILLIIVTILIILRPPLDKSFCLWLFLLQSTWLFHPNNLDKASISLGYLLRFNIKAMLEEDSCHFAHPALLALVQASLSTLYEAKSIQEGLHKPIKNNISRHRTMKCFISTLV